MKTLQLQRREGVTIVTMNHERENRLHPDLMSELMETLDSLEADKETKALVFTGGDPKFFSNGLDLGWIMAHAADPRAILGYLQQVNTLFHRVTLFPKPVVAALNGHTFAAGVFLAAHMDFRFMREDRGWVCMPEVDINIPLLPGMIAIMQATMSPQGFREMYYSGRRFTGPEIMATGWVDRVYPQEELLPAAVAFAAELGKKRGPTYAEMKRRVRADIAHLLLEEDPKLFLSTLSLAMPG